MAITLTKRKYSLFCHLQSLKQCPKSKPRYPVAGVRTGSMGTLPAASHVKEGRQEHVGSVDVSDPQGLRQGRRARRRDAARGAERRDGKGSSIQFASPQTPKNGPKTPPSRSKDATRDKGLLAFLLGARSCYEQGHRY